MDLRTYVGEEPEVNGTPESEATHSRKVWVGTKVMDGVRTSGLFYNTGMRRAKLSE